MPILRVVHKSNEHDLKHLGGILEMSIHFSSTLPQGQSRLNSHPAPWRKSEQLRTCLAQAGTWELRWMNGVGHVATFPPVTVTFRNMYCVPQFWGDLEARRRVISSRNKRHLILHQAASPHFPHVSLSLAFIFLKLVGNKEGIPCHYLSQDLSPLTQDKV